MKVIFAVRSQPDVVAELPAVPRVGEVVPITDRARGRVTDIEWLCTPADGWHVRLAVRMSPWDWLFPHEAEP